MRHGQVRPRYWTLDTTKTSDNRYKRAQKTVKQRGVIKRPTQRLKQMSCSAAAATLATPPQSTPTLKIMLPRSPKRQAMSCGSNMKQLPDASPYDVLQASSRSVFGSTLALRLPLAQKQQFISCASTIPTPSRLNRGRTPNSSRPTHGLEHALAKFCINGPAELRLAPIQLYQPADSLNLQ